MAAITWELYESRIVRNDILEVTIREFTDGLPTVVETLADGTDVYRTYSASMHKSKPEDGFKKLLRDKVLAGRTKVSEETTQAAKFDFSNFETYVKA